MDSHDVPDKVRMIRDYKYWYHKFEVIDGVFTEGEYQLEHIKPYLNRFQIGDIAQCRILDIATFDGGFAFGFEDLGATVVAMDIIDQYDTGFHVAREVRQSNIPFHKNSVYELRPEEHGIFDLVHYSGLHYHLKSPLLALDRINSVLKKGGILFGHGTSGEFFHRNYVKNKWLERIVYKYLKKMPIAYYLDGTYRSDRSNWILVNDMCKYMMLKRSGFSPDSIMSYPGEPDDWGTCYFKAVKTGEPDSEYYSENHMKSR